VVRCALCCPIASEVEDFEMPNCPFCNSAANIDEPTGDSYRWRCPRCGSYRLTGTAQSIIRERPITRFGTVSGWIRQQNALGITPSISDIGMLRQLVKPSFRERSERYLLAAVAKAPNLHVPFAAAAQELVGASFSEDDGDVSVIRQYLVGERLIEQREVVGDWVITPKGFRAADDLRAKRAASSQVFVAMWFHKDLDPAYDDGIDLAVRGAGYDPMIIRKKEHAGKIDDEIIAEIRRSAFLIADFTGQRGGVYFEAGYAMGRGLPVIWTCRQDEIEKLHFDIRQYNCIDWTKPADLRQRLETRIEALLGRGPRVG
jgi:nucleoside 2-deoxyribosyltransferase